MATLSLSRMMFPPDLLDDHPMAMTRMQSGSHARCGRAAQTIVDCESKSVMRYRHHRYTRKPARCGRIVEHAQPREQPRGSFGEVAVCAEIECDGGSWQRRTERQQRFVMLHALGIESHWQPWRIVRCEHSWRSRRSG